MKCVMLCIIEYGFGGLLFVDKFLIKLMIGGLVMWMFVVIVDNFFVLECLWGKLKINMVN